MNKSISTTQNFFNETEKPLEEIRFYTWPELVLALKKFQDLVPIPCSSLVLNKCLDCVVGRISMATETSPCASTSSPESSVFRLSTDTRSTESLKTSSSSSTWWFEDLIPLNPYLIKMVIKSMVLRKLDHGFISRFLFYYHKSKLVTAMSAEKLDLTESVVDMLCFLDHRSVSCKRLFGIHRVALNLGVEKSCKRKLEQIIGSQLDRANLDDLLVLSSRRTRNLYDVNLVLRFINSFLVNGMGFDTSLRLRKVASLIDLYITEVAADPYLKPIKFLALVNALPDLARESYDSIYHAIDLYLEVHAGLSEEEKMRICCGGLNYEKLSTETCKQLTQNPNFPTKTAIQALTYQQSKLKSLLKDTSHSGPLIGSQYSSVGSESTASKDEQIVIYAENLDVSCENDKLKVHLQAHLQGMQWRVVELEKACKKMQIQMSNMMKSKLSSSQSNGRSVVPMLCS